MADTAFQEGYQAFLDNLTEAANPYPSDQDEHLSWNDGYMKADDDNYHDS